VELTEYNPAVSDNGKPSVPITSSLSNNGGNHEKHGEDTHSLDTSDNERAGEPIIRLRNIHKTYLLGLEGVPALRGVSVTIHRGEFIVILGKSGGGKTSMLNIIGTIDKPTKGDIYISGKRISSKTTDTEVANLRLRKIGFCFQTFNLIGSMTAVENVELPMILHGTLSSSQIRERAMKLLTHVGLGDRAGHLPSQLSGGEQQRVTISRAIANNPDVLLLDEPTGDLDTKNSNVIMDLLLKLNREQNITLVFVTHDVSLKYFAHRVIHMLDGKISKIEHISAKRRANAERELNDAILSQNDPNKALAAKQRNKKEIEIRNPQQFYSYLTFKDKFDAKQKLLKEKRRKQRMLRRQRQRKGGNNAEEEEEEEEEEESDNEIVDEELNEIQEEEEEEEEDIDDMKHADENNAHDVEEEDVELETAESTRVAKNRKLEHVSANTEPIEEDLIGPIGNNIHETDERDVTSQ